MQRDDYMMREIPSSYRDNPAMVSTPEMQNYYDDTPVHGQSGNYAPFHSSANLSNPNFRNSQPAGFAEAPYMPPANPYENLEAPRNSDWLEKTQKSNKRSKFWVIGSVLTLAVLIAVGVTLGVLLTKKNSSSSSSSSAPSGTNPSDPSNFQKNPNLKHAFWGIAYTPIGAQLPDCGVTLDSVIEDIQLMSQITTNLRLYGADCNQSSLTLDAIQQTKVNMTVWLGNYPALNDNGTAYYRQKGEIQTALQQFGSGNVFGITVGNEFILDAVTAAGQSDPNGSAGDAAAAQLIPYINDTRNMLAEMNLQRIQVGNAEAGSYFNNEVLAVVDYGMSNVHPWFANVSIEQASGWVWEFFEQQNVEPASLFPNKPYMYIAETGWPTNTSTTLNYDPTDGPSNASIANLQYFVDTFACQAIQNGTEYFFFEYNDQPWQGQEYGGVEGFWGLFTADKLFKNITLPDCYS